MSNVPSKLLRPNLLALAVATAMGSTYVQAESAATAKKDEAVKTTALMVDGVATSGLDTLVTSAEMEKYNATDMQDIFKHDASISAGGSVGMSQKVYVRNIGEDSLNISVDGAEQAGSTFHHSGRVSIEPELIKQIEIEAGAGSATAGPGALGGSVRFVTKDPEDLLKPGQSVGGMLKSTYFSNGDGWKNTAAFYGMTDNDKVGGMINFTDFDQDNVEDGDGDEIPGSESNEFLGYAKGVLNITDEQRLTLSYESLEEKGDVLYKPDLIVQLPNRNIPEYTTSERETVIANYSFNPTDIKALDLNVNLYSTQTEQVRESTRFAGTYSGLIDTTGFTVQNTSLLGNNKLVYGANYRDDKSRMTEVGNPAYEYEETGDVAGVYIQDVIQVTEKFTLSAGARYDHYELIDAADQKITDGDVSPNISANYAITDGMSVSAGYAEAFRGPEVRDALKLDSYSNDADLHGETAQNIEVGMDFYGSNYDLSIGVYQTTIKDAIAPEDAVPWNSVYTNLKDDIKTKGFFASASYDINDFTLWGSLNISDTEADDGEKATRYVYGSTANSIGDTLVLGLDYAATQNWTLGWSAEFVKGIDDIEIETGGDNITADKPGYAVHDIYARWLPTGDDTLAVDFSVNNLFNEQYINHASVEDFTGNAGYDAISGYADPGRDVRISVAWKF